MKVVAIIAAGGRGQRMGGLVPKQLLDLGGRSILQRSLDVLDRSERIDEIVIAVPVEWEADFDRYIKAGKTPVVFAPGGDRRRIRWPMRSIGSAPTPMSWWFTMRRGPSRHPT